MEIAEDFAFLHFFIFYYEIFFIMTYYVKLFQLGFSIKNNVKISLFGK